MIKSISYLFIIAGLCCCSLNTVSSEHETIGELEGELLLINENTSGLPGGREDLERTRLFLWMELNAPLSEAFSFGASVYGNIGTDDEQDNRRNLDNSESNTIKFEQFYIDWNFSENGFIRGGKQTIPIKLSTMLWDKDIETLGATLSVDWLGEQNEEYQAAAGAYEIEHIFSEQSKFAFANFHFTVPVGDSFITSGITVMQVTDTGFLIQDNVRRTNTEAALVEGFDIALLDLSVVFSMFEQPLVIGLEASQNFALNDANQAYRINFILGDNAVEDGWQLNLHYQDIERDAAVAAFVDDDWWFATWMTGYRVSGSYGISEDTFVQLSYFDEELQANDTKRIFLELRTFF